MALFFLYLGMAAVLAFVVAIGVAAGGKGHRLEIAAWGFTLAILWPAFLVALIVDVVMARVTRLAKPFRGQ